MKPGQYRCAANQRVRPSGRGGHLPGKGPLRTYWLGAHGHVYRGSGQRPARRVRATFATLGLLGDSAMVVDIYCVDPSLWDRCARWTAADQGRVPTIATKSILVLGATGPTGRQVVAQALERGHQVTVFVRRPERLTTQADRLRVLTGSVPDDPQALAAAVHGQEAVISTLGVGQSLRSAGLITRSMPVIVQAMKSQGVRRLIFTSAYGVGETRRDVPVVPRVLMRVLFRDLYTDKARAEDELRHSGLDWTLVYPVTLTNGPRTGHYRAGERLTLRGFPRISRADVATFLLNQLDDVAYVRKGVLISA